MAQQGTPVDMSKLSPAEKDAMMQQVFSNATTVRAERRARPRGPIAAGSRERGVGAGPDPLPLFFSPTAGSACPPSTASSSSTSACHATARAPSYRASRCRALPSLPPCRRSDRNADRPNFALTRDARKPHRLCPSPRKMVSSCARAVRRHPVQGRRLKRGRELVRGQVHEQVLAVRGDRGADAGRRRRRRRAGRALIASLYE